MKTNQKNKKKHLLPKYNSKGFSLIELMVVISIISLLSSVILVTTVRAREKGKDISHVENSRTLSQALELYYQDNGVYPTEGMTTPCLFNAVQPSGEHCVIGQRLNTINNDNESVLSILSTLLKPYMTQLPSSLAGSNGNVTLLLFDQTFSSIGGFKDYQSNICYYPAPNSYIIWTELITGQDNPTGTNSHGYINTSENVTSAPCP